MLDVNWVLLEQQLKMKETGMNRQLLQKLYFQAVEICETDGDNSAWKFEEEFARLIIRECCIIADEYVEHGIPSFAIERHFGI